MDMFQLAGCLCMLFWLISPIDSIITTELLPVNSFQGPKAIPLRTAVAGEASQVAAQPSPGLRHERTCQQWRGKRMLYIITYDIDYPRTSLHWHQPSLSAVSGSVSAAAETRPCTFCQQTS